MIDGLDEERFGPIELDSAGDDWRIPVGVAGRWE